MSKVLQNNKTTISLGRLSYFVYFVACSCTSMEATVLSCRFSWLWSGMPKVLWSNKSPVSLERVEWFCWLFASSYFLHLVRYPLKLRKYAILALSGIACQPIRLSDVLNLKNSKRIWVIKLILCFHWSWKKYCYYGLWLKIVLANQFAGFSTFGLFDLLNLILRVHWYTVRVYYAFKIYK